DAGLPAPFRLPPALRVQGPVLADHGAGAVAGCAASARRPARRRGLRRRPAAPGGDRMIDDPRIEWIAHSDAESWVHGVAAEMVKALDEELAARGAARMLLSGGTTPAPVYAQLAVAQLDWPQVTVGLVDERWLSPQDSASNTRLVRECLLERAEIGHFETLVREGLSLPEAVHAANLEAGHAPDACLAVLGMGNDGHTASLFPGSRDLDRALA